MMHGNICLKGNQGAKWIRVVQDVSTQPDNAGYKIVFEAQRGRGFLGDLAVDDISITEGICPGKTLQ